MGLFRFRLRTLLKLRIAHRDQRQAELAESYRAAEVLQERRDQMQAELIAAHEQSRKAASIGAVDVDRLAGAHRQAWMLHANLRILDQQRTQLETEIERRRLALVEADRQVRILEKLRDHQSRIFQQDELRAEIREQDDRPWAVAREDYQTG